MTENEQFMQQALNIAVKARGRTAPNPMVGALLVKDGKVIAQGWHEKAGSPHAEIVALNAAGAAAKGADLYVTLEPCSHHGRTGPCADALIKAGVKKVFVAVRDANPLVAGRGIERLRSAGIEVEEGLLEQQAARLNEVFFKWVRQKMPFVVAKYAMTLDGKIATQTGDSKWISNELSRRFAHELRNIYDVIMVGVGTVIADDPELTCRIEGGRNPVRVILDSWGRIPLSSKLLHDNLAETMVVVTELAPEERLARLREETNAQVLQVASLDGHVDVRALMKYLGGHDFSSVLVEGGGEIHAAMLKAGLVDKLHAVIAPKIVGGRDAPGPVGGSGVEVMAQALQLKNIEVERLADDVMLTGYVRGEHKQCSLG